MKSVDKMEYCIISSKLRISVDFVSIEGSLVLEASLVTELLDFKPSLE